jgi:hypothetical protein
MENERKEWSQQYFCSVYEKCKAIKYYIEMIEELLHQQGNSGRIPNPDKVDDLHRSTKSMMNILLDDLFEESVSFCDEGRKFYKELKGSNEIESGWFTLIKEKEEDNV